MATASVADPAFAYIRVKRRRATVFLKVDPATETVAAVLGRLADLLQQPAPDMRLMLDNSPLPDDATLADAGVANDAVVAVVFRDADARGGWEPVDVEEFDTGGE